MMHREAFEKNRSVMLVIDPTDGAIRDANPAAAAFYGYSREALCNMNITQINTLPHDRVMREMQDALTECQGVFSFQHRLANGETRDVEVHSSPFAVDGQTLLFSIVVDISERRRNEEALILQHRLAAALAQSASLQESLEACLMTALQLSGMDSGGVYLREERTGEMVLTVHRGLSNEFVTWAARFTPDAPEYRQIGTGTPIYSTYAHSTNPVHRREGLCAVAAIPIKHQGQVTACLNIASHTRAHIDERCWIPLETVVSQMGSFVARALLLEKLRVSEERYRTLFQQMAQGMIR
ncbi:MAG TPA: PAS domain S-box protein [Candidatus Ozemobacteraceae bacterium]|nr:PAS domain S-box protein [Candidatus Ozemobacteraceae bacterium]